MSDQCNRKEGMVLGDNTLVGGFHFIGLDTKRICFTSPVETPGCSNSSIRFTAPPTEAEYGPYIGGVGGNSARNATVEDVSVEAFIAQNLFFMSPTKAGARVSQDITLRRLQRYGTWADGINLHGQHRNVLAKLHGPLLGR
jgi:hypothetical protein